MGLPCVYLEEKAAQGFLHGKPLAHLLPASFFSEANGESAAVFRKSPAGKAGLLGVVSCRDGRWGYGCVFGA